MNQLTYEYSTHCLLSEPYEKLYVHSAGKMQSLLMLK